MGILGGLDVGFGANMQVVRTNYLVVKTTAAGTTQQYANLLSLYNHNVMEHARGNNGLKCDYIVCSDAPSDAATVEDRKVIIGSATGQVDFPVLGDTNPTTHQNTNHGVIAVLSIGAIEFATKDLEGATAIAPVLADNNVMISNGELLKDLVGPSVKDGATTGVSKTVNLDGIMDDLVGALGGSIDMTGTDLTTGFVEKGNASGASANPADIAALSHTTNENALGVVSVVTLCGAGFM